MTDSALWEAVDRSDFGKELREREIRISFHPGQHIRLLVDLDQCDAPLVIENIPGLQA